MNIWILNHYAVPQKYYYLARSYSFAKNLIKAGHNVTIFAASSVHNSDINLIQDKRPYIEMNEDGLTYVLFYGRLYQGTGKDRIINHIDVAHKMEKYCPKLTEKYGKPDVIYASAGQSLTLVAGIRIAKKMGIRCVSEVTDLWPESFVAYGLISQKNPLLKLLYAGEKWIYKKSDEIIFSMEGGKDYIVKNGWDTEHGGPIDLTKVHYINNGVDLDAFDSNKEQFVFADPDLDDTDTFKVVYTGSIRRANKLDYIVSVARLLQAQGRDDIRLLLWGKGDQTEEIQGLIDKYGLKNCTLKGFVPKNAVPYILSKSDLNFYFFEKTPICQYGLSLNKSFEYFASGKPVLASNNTNYSIIDRYGCGVCLDEYTPEAMAKEIVRFADMPKDEYAIYCKNARRAAEDYDFKMLTGKLINIIAGAEL